MFKTLRSRLVLSHVLPFLIVIPLIGLALVYFLEQQFFLPQLTVDLSVDARLLAAIARSQPELFEDPQLAQAITQRYSPEVQGIMTFLSPAGEMLANSGYGESFFNLQPAELEKIQSGQVVTRINTDSPNPVQTIDVLAPVFASDQGLAGIVRLSYNFDTVLERLQRMRSWIITTVILGLALGVALGSLLGVRISRPIQQATQAVYRLAQGEFSQRLPERDPQELRLLAEAVNYLVDRLQNLETARQRLLANLVHELGRPLGALRTAIQALERGADQDPQLKSELLAGMDEETSRLQHLLEELNHLYDEQLGSLELELQEIDLQEWLPKVLRPWQEAAQSKRLEWQIDLANDLPTLRADPLRLGQAVGNLASNAVKFTPPGGKITAAAGKDHGEVWISFRDNGPGIRPEEREKIFMPFYQGESGRRIKQGMGLGLSIARELAIAHGGRLEVESEPGAGSQFSLWLPIVG